MEKRQLYIFWGILVLGIISGYLFATFMITLSLAYLLTLVERSANERLKKYRLDGIYIMLAAAVMRADKHYRKSELNTIKAYLKKEFGREKAKKSLQRLRRALKTEPDVSKWCGMTLRFFTKNERLVLLQALFGIAYADGEFSQSEQTVLKTITKKMALSVSHFYMINGFFVSRQYKKFHHQYEKQKQKQQKQQTTVYAPNYRLSLSCRVLGVPTNATETQVKQAYRTLAKQHHPDKVARLGEAYQKKAHERFLEIQSAYEFIRQYNNW